MRIEARKIDLSDSKASILAYISFWPLLIAEQIGAPLSLVPSSIKFYIYFVHHLSFDACFFHDLLIIWLSFFFWCDFPAATKERLSFQFRVLYILSLLCH